MYNVYAISSLIKKYIYVGMTNDIERRFSEHNTGKNTSTKVYKPFLLIYRKVFLTRIDARKKEKYLKSGIGIEFLKPLNEPAAMAKLVDALL